MVKISVVIPVYNVETYLRECLDSVLNQTFKDIEIICVNDGSTDNSGDILNEYCQKYENIIVITQENMGLGAARNTGMKHVNGEYIFFLDSDDYINKSALEKLYENISSNKSDVVFFKKAVVDNDGNINYKKPGFPLHVLLKDKNFNDFTFTYREIKKHVLNSSFAAWQKLYDKKFLDKYDDFIFPDGAFEDVLFHVKMILRAEKISYLNKYIYCYRDNPDSITHTNNGTVIFDIIRSVEDFLKENDYYDEFQEEFSLFKITQLLNYLMISQSEEYFQLTKREFENISLNENSLVNGIKHKRYELVLDCENLYEYYFRHDILIRREYENKINSLNSEIQSLKAENMELEENKSDEKSNKFFKNLKWR